MLGLGLWVLWLLVPGFCIALSTKLLEEKNVLEIVGLSFALGLLYDASSMFLLGQYLDVPVSWKPALLVAALPLVLLVKKSIPKVRSFSKGEVIALLLIGIQLGIVVLYFVKYPIFPQYESSDFLAHVANAQGLLVIIPNLETSVMYFGVHYLLAVALAFNGGIPLVTVREAMGVLCVVSSFVVYYGASQIFSSKKVGVYSLVLYSVGSFVWFGMVFNTGLYANFFGLLAAVTLLALAKEGKPAPFLLALSGAFVSHYSVLLVFPAVAMMLFLHMPKLRAGLMTALMMLPIPVGISVFPNVVQNISGFLSGAGPNIAPTQLASFMPTPFFQYLADEINFDLGAAAMLVLLCVSAWLLISKKSETRTLLPPLVWFGSLMVVAPFSPSAWRFSFVALIPLAFLSAYVLASALKWQKYVRGTKSKTQVRPFSAIASVSLCFIVVVGSWGSQTFTNSTTDTTFISDSQRADLAAIGWMGQHIRTDFVLSVSDYRFTFSAMLGGSAVFYAPDRGGRAYLCTPSSPEQFSQMAISVNATYLITTNVITEGFCNLDFSPWVMFTPQSLRCPNNCTVYSNEYIHIFKLTA